MMRRSLFRYRWHILFWAGYFIFWPVLSAYYYHQPLGLSVIVTLGWFLGQAGAIYLAVYRWIPRLLRPGRTLRFALILMAGILLSAAFIAVWMHLWLTLSHVATYTLPLATLYWYVCMSNFYWVLLAVGFVIVRERLRNERRNQRLEKEHMENELRFLKSQMNPHFLFNAINSIYVLIRKDPGLAEHTLARFSDMLRYQLYDCATDYIPIEKEVDYLESYIRLEQLRKGSMLCVDYDTEGSVRHFSVAPLLLMPLVENAFKFVSSFPDRDNRVNIRLGFEDTWFRFGITNTVDEQDIGPRQRPANPAGNIAPASGTTHTGSVTPAGGIGLENIRRRLELLYPGRHELTINAGKEQYSVSLKLRIV